MYTYATTSPKLTNTRAERLSAIDIVRGLAMVFMLLNHATWHVPEIDFRVNFGWDILAPPVMPFLTPFAWVGLIQGTPLFFIMAGFGVALFEYARRKIGWTEWQITRYFLIRGAVLIAVDWLVLPWQFYPELVYQPNVYFVLTTIGICLWLVAFTRLLPLASIIIIAVGTMVLVQAIYDSVTIPIGVNLSRMIFLYMTPFDPIDFGFPVLPWFCVILMGYMTMRYLQAHPQQFAPVTGLIAIVAWCLWIALARLNSFGVIFTLHPLLMTKHPPSLSYLAFYTGFTYLLLYVLHRVKNIQWRFPFSYLTLMGQGAFLFYILHFYVIDIFSMLLQDRPLHPFLKVLLISGLSLVPLYIISVRYRVIRKAYPDSLLKYL